MGRRSSDSDSDDSYKKSRRKSRYRSSSNSSNSSRYSSSRSRHKKCSKKQKKRSGRSRSKEQDKRSRSSRKRRDRYRRSHSQSASKSPARYRHRSKESDSGSTQRSRDRRRRRSGSKSSSTKRRSHSKDRTSQVKDVRLHDDGADLLEKLNKAAVQAMAENSKLREATLNLVVNQMAERETSILEIKQSNFTPKPFTSSASEKKLTELPTIIEAPEPQLKLTTTPKEFQDSLFHLNLIIEDTEEKLNKWARKLYLMRQRTIRGEPYPYG